MRKSPSWDSYFMNIALAISQKSKDPETCVGSILVDSSKRIIGSGFNGFPPGMKETAKLWQRPTKYKFVVHAELNALLFATKNAKGSTLYTTLFPCAECAKSIAAAGVKRVVYSDNKYANGDTIYIFNECKIKLEKI